MSASKSMPVPGLKKNELQAISGLRGGSMNRTTTE
jgi:hypothetical protein